MTTHMRERWLAGSIVAVSLVMVATFTAAIARRGDDYVYQEDLDCRVHFIRGEDLRYLGKLDRSGNFIPSDTGTKRIGFYSGYPLNMINVPRPVGPGINDNTEVVYEFRSGYLVLGRLNGVGDFIPAGRSRVIPFEKYRYSPNAPRIYNLPGRFVPADEKPKDNKSDAKK